jgi:hypothetical protein
VAHALHTNRNPDIRVAAPFKELLTSNPLAVIMIANLNHVVSCSGIYGPYFCLEMILSMSCSHAGPEQSVAIVLDVVAI